MDENVEVEVETDEGATVVESARELQRRLKNAFGTAALTTRIEEEGERVVVNGDGWQFTARRDDTVVFKPGGTSYRIVRDANALESVSTDSETEEVVFVFADEEIVLRRGVEHRR